MIINYPNLEFFESKLWSSLILSTSIKPIQILIEPLRHRSHMISIIFLFLKIYDN